MEGGGAIASKSGLLARLPDAGDGGESSADKSISMEGRAGVEGDGGRESQGLKAYKVQIPSPL